MSLEYAELLLKRARMYLESAKVNLDNGRFDVAVVEAEIAAQLALKALITKQGLEPLRTHAIRQLFSFILENRLLPSNVIYEIAGFMKTNREKLIILERARAIGQYGSYPVDKDEAEIAVNIAREVLEIVERYW